MSANLPYLEVVSGEAKGTQYRLVSGSAVIGRGSDCEIRLEEAKGVSRAHARVTVLGAELRVEDLESQNGTFVDGQRISTATVPSGSRIKVGQTVLQVMLPGSDGELPAPAAASAPAARDSARVARRPSSQAPAAAAGRGAALPATSASDELLDPEGMVLVAGRSSQKFFFTILAAAVAIVGGLYAVKLALEVRPYAPPPYRLVEVRESRVFAVDIEFDTLKVKGESVDGEELIAVVPFGEKYDTRYGGMLAAAVKDVNARNVQQGYRPLNFVVVTGKGVGNASVLFFQNGNQTGEMRVLVRGVRPPEWREDISPQEALERGTELELQAAALADSQHAYFALKKLGQAQRLYLYAARDIKRANAVTDTYNKLRKLIETDLALKFQTAVVEAFPDRNAFNQQNLVRAFQGLEDAQRLVPDEENLDWQVLEAWKGKIRQMIRDLQRGR